MVQQTTWYCEGETDSCLQQLFDRIPAGSEVRIMCSLSCLYFSAETKCKLSVEVEILQLLKAGTGVAVQNYSFEDRFLRVAITFTTRAEFKLEVQ